MPHDRYYTPRPLSPDQTLVLSGEEARHARVMRAKAGGQIELINGKGAIATATLLEVKKRELEVRVEAVQMEEEPAPHLILAQALPKPSRLDLILEKGTELGASRFLLFPGERSEKTTLSTNQLERAKRITIAAMKQSGRLYLPEIQLMPPLEKWTDFPKTALFGDLREGAPLLKNALPEGPEAAFFVGPEAGFTEGEITLLEQRGAKGVKLHNLILRTDTAPLVALALLSHLSTKDNS